MMNQPSNVCRAVSLFLCITLLAALPVAAQSQKPVPIPRTDGTAKPVPAPYVSQSKDTSLQIEETRRVNREALALLKTLNPTPETSSPVPSMREQADIQQQWLKARLDRVLPKLM